jgi:hypothetical protein
MFEKVSEVGRMRFEIIGSLTCDTNFIKAAAAHNDPDTIMLDIYEIMEDLIEAVNNKDAEDDPYPISCLYLGCVWPPSDTYPSQSYSYILIQV